MKRIFVALEIPENIKEKIEKSISDLDLKIISKENWHITLIFIGDADENKLQVIINKLQKIEFPKFEIKTQRIRKYKGRIWVEIKNNKIEKLAELIYKKLDLRPELRKFKAHISLGRSNPSTLLRPSALRLRLEEMTQGRAKRVKIFKPIDFKEKYQANSFILFESKLLPQGSKYTKIKEFNLIDN